MKKSAILLIFLLLSNFIILNLTSAQEEVPGLPSGLQPGQVEETKQKAETKWEYLSKEWQTIIFKNKFMNAINSFFMKISIVFKILFGMPYSFSMLLWGIIFLWLWMALKSAEIIRAIGFMKGGFSYSFGMALSIIFAQIGLFRIITQFCLDIIFKPEMWWARLLIFFTIIVLICVLSWLNAKLSKYLKEAKKKRQEEEVEQKGKEIIITAESMKKAAKGASAEEAKGWLLPEE